METVTVQLALQGDYRFEVDFGTGGAPPLITDATAPLGQGAGPDAEALLVAAVANCLSASLLCSLRKYKNHPGPMRTTARARLAHNERGRLRVGGIEVEVFLGAPFASFKFLDRALAQFEDFCVVTQSVRVAIPVAVRIFDCHGAEAAPPIAGEQSS